MKAQLGQIVFTPQEEDKEYIQYCNALLTTLQTLDTDNKYSELIQESQKIMREAENSEQCDDCTFDLTMALNDFAPKGTMLYYSPEHNAYGFFHDIFQDE